MGLLGLEGWEIALIVVGVSIVLAAIIAVLVIFFG